METWIKIVIDGGEGKGEETYSHLWINDNLLQKNDKTEGVLVKEFPENGKCLGLVVFVCFLEGEDDNIYWVPITSPKPYTYYVNQSSCPPGDRYCYFQNIF